MKTQFLQLAHGKIAYDDSGSGMPIVCVPGMGVLRSEFRYMSAALVEAGYRVISMDLRGHGESSPAWDDYSVPAMGQDILALIRHLDAGPVVVVGHSFSGASAVWAAAERPDLVSGLVLIGPAVRGKIGGAMGLMLRVLAARPWGPAAWLRYYSTLFPARKPADWEAYTTALKQNLTQPGRLEALRSLMFEGREASEESITKVTVPTMVLMGSKDPDFKDPEAEAQWIAAQINQSGDSLASYQMIEGAGHYPQTEMPEISVPLVMAFLENIETEEPHGEATR